MPAKQNRGFLITLFAIVGCLWFGLHAVEYVAGRYASVAALLPLPTDYGYAALMPILPAWASWAMGAAVWLGLLGSVLLLLRDRAAVIVLAFAFLAALISFAWGVMAMVNGQSTLGGVDVVRFTAALAAVAMGCWLYARVAKRSGAL